MVSFVRFAAVVGLVAVLAGGALGAAPATWTGKISDSMCGIDKHQGDGTAAGDHDCVAKCVRAGSAYVLVVGTKVYKIQNQDFAGLAAQAGHVTAVTGELKAGTTDTIIVSKIEGPRGKSYFSSTSRAVTPEPTRNSSVPRTAT